jgi:hypothetical protein
VRPSSEWTIEAFTGGAAFLVNGRQGIPAANHLGRAFFAPLFASPSAPSMARFTYLDPRARTSTPIGTGRRENASPPCGRRSGGNRSTAASPIWSVS